MKAYIYKVQIHEEEDGRWSVLAPAMPGCTSWGYSKDEALRNIQEAVQCHIEVMLEDGDIIPVDEIGRTNIIPSAAGGKYMIDKLRNKTAREIVTALRRDGFRLARLSYLYMLHYIFQ